MAIKSRDARASELDKMERECRYRLGQANLRYNEALVRTFPSLHARVSGALGPFTALALSPFEGSF